MPKQLLIRLTLTVLLFCFFADPSSAQKGSASKNFAVIAYYAGRTSMIDSFEMEKLTHLIFSFCNLNGNKLHVSNARDTATILRMVQLKKRNPQLKIILSLGGWGGCKTCSEVFSTRNGRRIFARSVKQLSNYFETDGIDLDWEYPAISGFPGHVYGPADKPNFTALIVKLRKKLSKKLEISFAAGGFTSFIDSSVDWKKVMPETDRVNLMSYDLVSGFSTVSGHHTPLYSTPKQVESVDNGVKQLIKAGVPPEKIVIGAAFYARLFEVSDTSNNGLYLPAQFHHGLSFSRLADSINIGNGFTRYWDTLAKAPYAFNVQRKLMATYDDTTSIKLKTRYALENNLNGIMFWQLADDNFTEGLLNIIDKAKKEGSP